MAARDSFYLGALLHDVGKFIQRARLPAWTRAARERDYVKLGGRIHAHKRYSAAFIRLFRSKPFLSDSHIEDYVLHHHAPRDRGVKDFGRTDIPIHLIRIADVWASKEREKVRFLEPVAYSRARLQSIFSSIRLKTKAGEDYTPNLEYHDLRKLSILQEALFPAGQTPRYADQAYRSIIDDFMESFGKVRDDDEFLSLLWKYFNAVPAQTPNRKEGSLLDRPDINLFDHSRVTAAIALCLYDEWQHGDWKDKEKTIRDYRPGGENQDTLPAPCILIGGDISGIQKFIFNVPSKGAAKTLKARSFYVQLFADLCARKVLEYLDLKPANLLYNGGARFYILAPKYRESQLDKCRIEIMQSLLSREFIDDELYLSLASVVVAPGDFMNKFGQKWAEVNQTLDVARLQKFRQSGYGDVFEPKEQRRVSEAPEKGDLYTDITTCLKEKSFQVSRAPENDVPEGNCWRNLFWKMGYVVDFPSGVAEGKTTLFNSTDFEGNYSDFRFAVKDLPLWTKPTIEQFMKDVVVCGRLIEEYQDEDDRGNKLPIIKDNIITYSQLAFKAFAETGTEKLGILKMDVDDLGLIFSEGFDEKYRTPSRMMSLSRSLQWFFEGYMNTILRDDQFRDYIYPIFSGGDDLFMVGAWHKVFDLALRIHEEFQRFVCDNPSLTLSASLLVVDEHYPVSRFAVLAEERLHEAKYGSLNKNSVNVLGETLSWEEFKEACDVKKCLFELVDETGVYKVSRSVIYKVLHSCEGLSELHDRAQLLYKAESSKDMTYLSRLRDMPLVGEKMWRMSYMLRDIRKDEAKEKAKSLIDKYESVVKKAIKGEPVNPMYVAVGARWAELATRYKQKCLENQNQENHAE
ncbi:MAG: type III-A CRISPR-associated protein Cas10/Csm1 [Chlorobiaceae bacterium]|nr:type III-A CRISPR-associated protein Cas10/Csm1 [Chlorobiaceae bacterium]